MTCITGYRGIGNRRMAVLGRDLDLIVTVDAPHHLQGGPLICDQVSLYFTVTRLTFELWRAVRVGSIDMYLVTEVHEVGQIINFDPGDRLVASKVIRDLLNVGRISFDHFMASHASVERGYPSRVRTPCSGVTVFTVDLVLDHVLLMAKGDGLFRVPAIN